MDNASPNTVTVPPNGSVAFAVGTQITVRQVGAGQTIIAAGTGVTINTPETQALKGQHASATLIKVATDDSDHLWVIKRVQRVGKFSTLTPRKL